MARYAPDTGGEVALSEIVALENVVVPLADRGVAPRLSVALRGEWETIGDGVLHLSCLSTPHDKSRED